MSNPNTPSFSSSELQAAYDGSKSALEGFEEARNKVSQDIRALEAYLGSLDLRAPFRYATGKCIVADPDQPDQNIAAALEWSGSASGIIEEDALLWAEHNGAWRLLHERTRWEGSVDLDVPGGPYFCDEKTAQRTVKPLIETKLQIRKDLYPRLADFMRALSDYVSIREGMPLALSQFADDPF